MSEGEGGFKPITGKEPVNRREFLKSMFKVGVGATAVAAGVEIIPGQKPKPAEATSLETDKQKKVVMVENDTSQFNPIGANFRILSDPNVSQTDEQAVQKLHFEQISGTAVSVSQLLIDIARKGNPPTKEQMDAIQAMFAEVEVKVNKMLAPNVVAPAKTGL